MRNLNFHQYNPQPLPKLGIITTLIELSKHDFIYVLRKIKNGDPVSFVLDSSRFWDSASIAVYYKGYKLGYLAKGINTIVKKALSKNNHIEAVIQKNNFKGVNSFESIDLMIKIH
ncbi:MAG: hypothetical protein CL853_08465 [Crocinitomicaceae bacterium]|nr:hypothetical protein [Crocinitomicaceae bacterium]|tara:strand:- start:936 stop:1280 length:345 start_codon:yes stop_codon:yes gene_type:complete